jgi:hypothetical protein
LVHFSLPLVTSLRVCSPLSAQIPTPAYDQGVAARRAGDASRAAPLLEQAVREVPVSADAQVQLGHALLEVGRLDESDRAHGELRASQPPPKMPASARPFLPNGATIFIGRGLSAQPSGRPMLRA